MRINTLKEHINSLDFLWLSLVIFLALIIAYLLPLQPQDYWWYLRLGRDILSSGAIPKADTFSYTQAGHPLIYQFCLSAILLWLEFMLGGLTLTFLFHGLVIGITYALMWLGMRLAGSGPRLASLITVLLILTTSNNWEIRPQAFTYPLFVLSLLILWSWQQGHSRGLIAMPLISLLWVNLHGSFVLQFVLMGSALVFGKGDRKALGLAAGAALITSLLNPYGPGSWGYVAGMVASPSVQLSSSEWDPPVNLGWQMNLYFLWRLSFAPMAVFSSRRLTLLEWVWFLGFAWQASTGIRFVVWFLFILALCTAMFLPEIHWPFPKFSTPPGSRVMNTLLGVLLLVSTFALLPGVRERWWSKAPAPYGASTPIRATEWLASHPDLPGELWSNFGFSSYLEYALPARRVWIDTRFEIYPEEQWQGYLEIASGGPDWQTLLEKDHVNILMLSIGGEPRLIQAVEQAGGWCEPYRDSNVVIFTRLESGQSCT